MGEVVRFPRPWAGAHPPPLGADADLVARFRAILAEAQPIEPPRRRHRRPEAR
jgi:hypothetical protein